MLNLFVGLGSGHSYRYTGVSKPTCLIIWLPTIPTSSLNFPNHSQNNYERCLVLFTELLLSVPVVDGLTLALRHKSFTCKMTRKINLQRSVKHTPAYQKWELPGGNHSNRFKCTPQSINFGNFTYISFFPSIIFWNLLVPGSVHQWEPEIWVRDIWTLHASILIHVKIL